MSNLKVYGVAVAVALAIAVVAALVAVAELDAPHLSSKKVLFDGTRAVAEMRAITAQFTSRTAGSDADNRCAAWVAEQFGLTGLETRVETFTATIEGRDVPLQNVWAVSRGSVADTVLVIANRDTPAEASQGANNNASGLAVLVELARSASVTAHRLTFIFLATTGDALGAVGSRQFLETYDGGAGSVRVVLALRELATLNPQGLALDGWSLAPKASPPWLWLMAGPGARVYTRQEALLPGTTTQLIRLAAPFSDGGQAPYVAEGLPGLTISASGDKPAPSADVRGNVSGEELTRAGGAVEAMLLSMDSAPLPADHSGGALLLDAQRALPQWALRLILAAGFLPLLAVTVDLFAQCRRARLRLRGAYLKGILRALPWLIALGGIYSAAVLGLAPEVPGIVLPPSSPVVAEPRYLFAGILLAVLVIAYIGLRPLERRVPADTLAVVFVTHAGLLVVTAGVWLVNPYAVLFVLPAALLWPLARRGRWVLAVLPVALALAVIPIFLLAYARMLDLGWTIWWYLLLLLATGTIPAALAVLGAFYLGGAGMLEHGLRTARVPARRKRGQSISESEPAPAAAATPARFTYDKGTRGWRAGQS